MGIVYGTRNGVKGRFSEQSWPIAAAAGWELFTGDIESSEPPVEVISFLKDVRASEIQAETVEIILPEIEDEPDELEPESKPTAKPRGRKPKN